MKKKICIIDDDSAILEALSMILEDEGYDVVTISDGAKVTELEYNYPDLLLLDIWMTGWDGRDICAYLKTNPFTRSIPVIMVSANKDTQTIAKDAGADDFITKPFDMNHLLHMVSRYTK